MDTIDGRMTPAALAALLNGREYRDEITLDERRAAKEAGLVVVYGYSDNNMEFHGAIDDEIGCYDGGTAYLTGSGILQNDCDVEACPYFAKVKDSAATIKAVWCAESTSYAWTYETAIPHETFAIFELGEPFCRGIVFALADVGKVTAVEPPTTWRDRLAAELADLDARLAKLRVFLRTDECMALSFEGRGLLARQARAMEDLSYVLARRVELAGVAL